MKYLHAAREWLRVHWVESAVISLGVASILSVLSAKTFRGTGSIQAENAARLGEFVGGFLGTILALLTVSLIYATLRNQRESFEKQNFETKLFELVKMHRENAAETEVGRCRGRRVFVLLIREFRVILTFVRDIAGRLDLPLNNSDIIQIAYYVLYYGVGPNSSRMLKSSLSEFNNQFIDLLESELNSSTLKTRIRRERKLGYLPFEGHQSRLGHYYRHLYQTVKYVNSHGSSETRYEYAKIIRAQLTNHEQALLLINSLTPLGQNWWVNGYMENYRMVQNIPRQFFDRVREINMSELFGKKYFEWQE
jgi:Putative phage abortive infection protein